MKITYVAKVVTNIILALVAIFCIYATCKGWSPDGAYNIGLLIGDAILLGAAKICQVVVLIIARGADSIPMLFKKDKEG